MKTGISLVDMAKEIERRKASKRDFVADTRKLEVASTGDKIVLQNGNAPLGEFGIRPYAHRQLGEHLQIPAKFYDRLRAKHPDVLAHTVNQLLQREPSRQMVRTLDGDMRAFLSDRYRPLDDSDLAEAVLPELLSMQDLRIESTQFTETRMYIKAVFPRIQTEVRKGDVVQSGIVISNSEVGAGSLQVVPMVFRLVCLNGMIAADYGQRRYHVGRRAEGDSESAFELFSDVTKRLDDAALWSKVRDTVRGVLKADVLTRIVERMREATEQRLEGSIEQIVEVTAQRFAYSETAKTGILRHLIEGADLTRYGLMNAITRQSQDEEDYETATKMEADGGALIELPQTQWREIVKQAA